MTATVFDFPGLRTVLSVEMAPPPRPRSLARLKRVPGNGNGSRSNHDPNSITVPTMIDFVQTGESSPLIASHARKMAPNHDSRQASERENSALHDRPGRAGIGDGSLDRHLAPSGSRGGVRPHAAWGDDGRKTVRFLKKTSRRRNSL
jgi:hypothetical protein